MRRLLKNAGKSWLSDFPLSEEFSVLCPEKYLRIGFDLERASFCLPVLKWIDSKLKEIVKEKLEVAGGEDTCQNSLVLIEEAHAYQM